MPARAFAPVALDLQALANLATALALLVAVVFGALQFRHAQRRRKDALMQEAIHLAQSESVINAIELALAIPDPVLQTFDAQPKESQQAAWSSLYIMEAMGFMVWERMLGLHDLDLFMGGATRGLWKKFKPLVEATRVAQANPGKLEWLQWLAERMVEDPAPGKNLGAHVAFRDWKR